MTSYKNISENTKFGKLTVSNNSKTKIYTDGHKVRMWLCKCECGKEKWINGASLRRGYTTSCGCNRGKTTTNHVGKKLGRLSILSKLAYNGPGAGDTYLCACSCGNQCEKTTEQLRRHKLYELNCGCWKREPRIDFSGQKVGRLLCLHPLPNNGKGIHWKCLCKCGNEVSVCVGSLSSKATKSCGCLQKEIARRNSGKNHYKFKEEISDEERAVKRFTTVRYKKWRSKVFKRDNYTCQLSGQSGDLCAHHIQAWASYKNLRYRTSNGITLSRKLHMLFHALYGRGNNTKKQFKEFSGLYENKKLKA